MFLKINFIDHGSYRDAVVGKGVTAQGLRTSGTRRERLGRAVGVGCRYERPEGVRKEQGRQGIGKGRSCIKVSFK